jgi:hypothetical protein
MSRRATLWFVLLAAGAGVGCGPRLVGQSLAPDGGMESAVMSDAVDTGAAVDMNVPVDTGTAVDTNVPIDTNVPVDTSAPVDANDGGADSFPDANDGDGSVVVPDLPRACTAEGWCWTHPLPTSDRFVQAFTVGSDELWLVGASGVILRLADGVWSTMPAPPTDVLSAWASASNDIWIGGPAGPYHWNGSAWERILIPVNPVQRDSNAIWGCAPNNVWLVGSIVYNWDGTQLVSSPMPATGENFKAVWGSGCKDVWAGALNPFSGGGRIMHWDGTTWSQVAAQPAEQIAGTGPDDVWTLANGQLFHWTGPTSGSLQDSRTVSLFPVGAAAVGTVNDNRMLTVFARGGGVTALPSPVPDGVSKLWGRAADDIWGFGALGFVTHWNGETWTGALPGWALTRDDAVEVTGTGPTDLWAVAGATLLHGDGTTWKVALTPKQVGGRINDVWARAADDVWVLGADILVHRWNGSQWRTEAAPPVGDSTEELRAVSGTGPNDVWILRGTRTLANWDGTSWTPRLPDLQRVRDLWAAAPGDVWVVGDDGVAHLSAGYWRKLKVPINLSSTPFTAVGGSGPTDVWLLAAGYTLKANADATELVVALNSDDRAASLTPVAGGGVWVLYESPTNVSRLQFMTDTDPYTSPRIQVVAPAGLSDVWLAPDGALWAAGKGGALLRRAPTPPTP